MGARFDSELDVPILRLRDRVGLCVVILNSQEIKVERFVG